MKQQKWGIAVSWPWVGGMLFTFCIAIVGWTMSKAPGVGLLGPMLISIIIAVAYRQAAGYPEKLRPGIDFAAKKILRLAIIMYGFKLNVAVILHDGLALLAVSVLVIAMALLITLFAAKRLKADPILSLLLAAGTGVCGAAAIAAVSPIASAKEEDTAIGVGIIALTGTIFAAVYTLLYTIGGMDGTLYGIWTGLSLHEIAHVVAASAPAGEEALAMALLAKLSRVFMLMPLCFLLTLWINRKRKANGEEAGQAKAAFPWFLVGFTITSMMGTFIPAPKAVLNALTLFSTFLLTSAMVGLGLNVSLRALRDKALRPAAAMLIASVFITVISYFIGSLIT